MEQTTRLNEPDLLLDDWNVITLQADRPEWGMVPHGSVVVGGDRIRWVGPAAECDPQTFSGTVIPGRGRFLTPGLIDCHTHLVWGGSRADEWEMRLQGTSYEEMARRGGGILSTVRATREAAADELYSAARDRVEGLMQEGVTTLEIKSGYGLDTETELKMLQVATDLRDSMPVGIQRTFLGAHALPAEFAGRPDDYIDLVCERMMPAAAQWCEAVDVFCEGIGFDVARSRRVLEAGDRLGKHLRIHAEQLSLLGGARLVAELGGRSADHLEYLDELSVRAMAEAGTVAVLLPGAFYFIQETQRPPVGLLRQYNVPIALATDANPGSSPVASLLLMLNMGCTLFGLTPLEAVTGVTRHAARVLGLDQQIGTIEPGKRADLAAWQIDSPAELAYGIGHNPCVGVWCGGQRVLDGGGALWAERAR